MLSVYAAQRLSMARRVTRFVVIPGLSLAGAAGLVAGTVMLIVTATGSGSEIWGTTVLVEGVVFVAGGLMGGFVFDFPTEPVGWSKPVEECLITAVVLSFAASTGVGFGPVGNVIAATAAAMAVVLLLGCAVAASPDATAGLSAASPSCCTRGCWWGPPAPSSGASASEVGSQSFFRAASATADNFSGTTWPEPRRPPATGLVCRGRTWESGSGRDSRAGSEQQEEDEAPE